MSISAPLDNDFAAELHTVSELLKEVAQQLDPPLSQLVLSQIMRAVPHRRAAVVLAFSVAGEDAAGDGLPDEQETQQIARRVYLAAALELLFIAQRIHHLLLNADTDAMNKSLMGSTILAGDYCFSRSADLAVRTDSPNVVKIFSTALKRLSEDSLRTLFDDDAPTTGNDAQLFASGIEASLLLADPALTPDKATADTAQRWTTVLMNSIPAADLRNTAELNPKQRARVKQLYKLL